jgi:tRNA pseudouridine55 synthase
MYSALKHNGKPLYRYAREGVAIDRAPRAISIHELRAETLSDDEMQIVVACGTGTYVRTLAEDIGCALDCGGAYLTALRRTGLGPFRVSDAFTLEAIEEMPMDERDHCLLPADDLAGELPRAELEGKAAVSFQQGQKVGNYVCTAAVREGEKVRVYGEESRFLGVGEVTADQKIAPRRLISPAEYE